MSRLKLMTGSNYLQPHTSKTNVTKDDDVNSIKVIKTLDILCGGRNLKIRIVNINNLGEKRKKLLVRKLKTFLETDTSKTIPVIPAITLNERDEAVNDRSKICKHCDTVFFSNRALTIHNHTMHGVTLGYKCSICGKQFNRKQYLRLHMRHHNKTTFNVSCHHCGSIRTGLKTYLAANGSCINCMSEFQSVKKN